VNEPKTADTYDGPQSRPESLIFIANEIGGAVDEQLSTADALDVKIGGLLALSVGGAFASLGILAPLVSRLDVYAAVGTGLASGYGLGCWIEALRGLRASVYRRWPNPAEYVKLADAPVMYEVGDLARQAADEKARSHARNREELLWKASRLRWTLAFVSAQLAVTMLTALHAITL
jgi:hypothetical protein